MKVKTAEATGEILNFMVAKASGRSVLNSKGGVYWGQFSSVTPTTSWAQVGPLLESERLCVQPESGANVEESWSACYRDNLFNEDGSDHWQTGSTPLVAACRCFVASKLGEEVEIPDELL